MTADQRTGHIIESYIKQHEETFRESFSLPVQIQTLKKISDTIAQAIRAGNKLLLCGNGGSAADAQHIAAEFTGRFKNERPGLPAISLTTDTSALTAIGNDYSFDVVFSRQIEALGRKGDVLIAISTSGNSKNVLEAAKKAKSKEMSVIGFTGKSGGSLKNMADINFCADADSACLIQEIHITALHAICDAIDQINFSTPL